LAYHDRAVPSLFWIPNLDLEGSSSLGPAFASSGDDNKRRQRSQNPEELKAADQRILSLS
jgi:hypothetical protein